MSGGTPKQTPERYKETPEPAPEVFAKVAEQDEGDAAPQGCASGSPAPAARVKKDGA